MKLQSLLQENPRRIRPSLRKSSAISRTKTDDTKKPEQAVKVERSSTPRKKQVAMTTEVWEIDTDSDVELLGSCEAAMAAPSLQSSCSPKVSWTILQCMMQHLCHDSEIHAPCKVFFVSGKHLVEAPPYDFSQNWWQVLQD